MFVYIHFFFLYLLTEMESLSELEKAIIFLTLGDHYIPGFFYSFKAAGTLTLRI